MTQPRFAVAITADDKTAAGVKSAEKRISGVSKNAARYTSVVEKAAARASGRSGFGALVGTMGQVERATSRAFGGSSPVSGALSRLSAIGSAGSAVGTGLGEAATGAGIFRTALAATATVAGATIGVLAAAGFAAFKMGDNWAKGAAGIGRTSALIGVATKDLQAFTAAAERAGVDKGTASSALGSVSQTLNDARYGRNMAAVTVLSRLGVKMRTNSDGTVDVGAMLPDIATAIARQNSSGRRTAASNLGIPLDALAAFTQGGAALSADMADATKSTFMLSDADTARAQRIQRKGIILSQTGPERLWGEAGSKAASFTEGTRDVGSALLSGTATFSSVVSDKYVPATETLRRASGTMERAATVISNGLIGRADAGVRPQAKGVFHSTQAVLDAIHKGAAKTGVSETMLRSIAAQESRFDPTAQPRNGKGQVVGKAMGLFQFMPQTWLGAIKQHGAEFGLGKVASQIKATRRNGRLYWTTGSDATDAKIATFRSDPYLSTLFTGALMRDAAPGVARAAGHSQATAGDLYTQHFLGPDKARRFFAMERANPSGSAVTALPLEAHSRGNEGLFWEHGSKGGRANSMQELVQLLIDKSNRPIEIHVTAPSGTLVTAKHGGSEALARVSHSPVGRR